MKKALFLLMLLWGQIVLAQPMSCLVADVDSGYIFVKENSDVPLPPASLAKVMTLYLTFSALDKGWLNMDSPLPISEWAASQEPSNLDLIAGDTITVREAILALIVKSANDVAVVLAESMAPSEGMFAEMMTQAAAQLGMYRTVFKNASGLHNPEQFSCAQDMAVLTLAMIKNFPKYYPLFATQSFSYHGRDYHTHNHVLLDYEGAEGLKTGYISAVGYNIISTAKKHGNRLVGVVMGDQSVRERDAYVKALLDMGFEKVKRQKQAVDRGLIQPAFNPLQRRAMVGNLNMAVFAPLMKRQLQKSLALGKKFKKNWKPIAPSSQLAYGAPLDSHWAIQIGAFHSQEKALSMANRALSFLQNTNCSVQTQRKHEGIYRSRLTGFQSKQLAEEACRTLTNKNYSCFVLAAQGDK